ncbi:MAG TPA: AraC family transcriptional regulator [Rhizomicrobium sp.]|nr:AraC family transcriptional regulator [Rhizomicrobium sp.]
MLDGLPPDFGVLRYWSSRFSAPDRIDSWRAVMARKLIRVEVDAIQAYQFHARAQLRIFEGIRFGTGTLGPSITRRGPDLVAQENDDLFFIVNLTATLSVRLRSNDIALAHGDACLLSCADPWIYVQPKAGRVLAIRVARAALALLLPDLEDKIGQVIPRGGIQLRMLLDYLSSIDRAYAFPDRNMRATLTEHIQDLMALTLGAVGDNRHAAAERGLKAAHVRAMKDDLLRSFSRKDLSLSEIAAKHGMSRRSLQRIFELEGSTFQSHLLTLRLEATRDQLRNPRAANQTIAEIASACGFGDISHFNHSFRKRFGASPSDVRTRGRDEQ